MVPGRNGGMILIRLLKVIKHFNQRTKKLMKKFLNIAFIILQVVLPKHLLSRLVARAANTKLRWLKNSLINLAVDAFHIDTQEAISDDPDDYATFNDFFMRELKEGARKIDDDKNIICSPCDGEVSQCGKVENGFLIQAKGKYYELSTLLAGNKDLADSFQNGYFATIYLSPRDYHRVHMPCDGKLTQSIYVPGELFSVNQNTTEYIQGLFARNERLISVFDDTQGKGVMASIMVGAMLVAGIETAWAGQVVPPRSAITTFDTQKQKTIKLKKGEEMGRFKFGSTVILLFPENSMNWLEDFQAGKVVKMGDAIGRYQ